MSENNEKIQYFRTILLKVNQVFSWVYGEDFSLIESNCTWEMVLKNFFLLDSRERLLEIQEKAETLPFHFTLEQPEDLPQIEGSEIYKADKAYSWKDYQAQLECDFYEEDGLYNMQFNLKRCRWKEAGTCSQITAILYQLHAAQIDLTHSLMAFFTELLDFVKAGGSRITRSYFSPSASSFGSRSNTSAQRNFTLSGRPPRVLSSLPDERPARKHPRPAPLLPRQGLHSGQRNRYG